MAPGKITPYLIYLVFVTTLGPLQFGYHLVLDFEITSYMLVGWILANYVP